MSGPGAGSRRRTGQRRARGTRGAHRLTDAWDDGAEGDGADGDGGRLRARPLADAIGGLDRRWDDVFGRAAARLP